MKFKVIFTTLSIAFLLAGCNDAYRNKPQQQAEDMEICRKANMEAYINGVGEIRCSPKSEEYANLED